MLFSLFYFHKIYFDLSFLNNFPYAEHYEAPRVTAKGEDEVAFSMRRIAEENDVPVVE